MPLHDARPLPGPPPRPGAGQRVDVFLDLLRRQGHGERGALAPPPRRPRRRRRRRGRRRGPRPPPRALPQVPRPRGRGRGGSVRLRGRRRCGRRRRRRRRPELGLGLGVRPGRRRARGSGSRLRRRRTRSRRQRGGGAPARLGRAEPVRGVAQVAHELGTERLDPTVVRLVVPDGMGPAVGRRRPAAIAGATAAATRGRGRGNDGRHALGGGWWGGLMRPRLGEVVRRRCRRLRPRICRGRHGREPGLAEAAVGSGACVADDEAARASVRWGVGVGGGEKVLRPQPGGVARPLAFCYGSQGVVSRGQPGNSPGRTRGSEVSALGPTTASDHARAASCPLTRGSGPSTFPTCQYPSARGAPVT